MARRSTVQHDPRIAGDPELSARPETSNFESRRSARRGWSGGGGRWLVATGRVIVWALILVVLANGVVAIVTRFTQPQSASSGNVGNEKNPFPTEAAKAFAVQFAHLYLDLNPAELSIRAARLKPYLSPQATEQFGWDGYGRLQAAYLQPAGVETIDSNNVVVTVSFQSGDKRYQAAIPLVWDGNGRLPGFAVSGQPGILPAPAPAELPVVAQLDADEVVEAELRPQLAEFFGAYASGVQLQRYLATDTNLPNLGGAFTFVELKDLVVPVGDATSRDIQAVVVWGVPGASGQSVEPTPADPSAMAGRLEQAYRLTVVKQGDKWYVKAIRGAGRAVG